MNQINEHARVIRSSGIQDLQMHLPRLRDGAIDLIISPDHGLIGIDAIFTVDNLKDMFRSLVPIKVNNEICLFRKSTVQTSWVFNTPEVHEFLKIHMRPKGTATKKSEPQPVSVIMIDSIISGLFDNSKYDEFHWIRILSRIHAHELSKSRLPTILWKVIRENQQYLNATDSVEEILTRCGLAKPSQQIKAVIAEIDPNLSMDNPMCRFMVHNAKHAIECLDKSEVKTVESLFIATYIQIMSPKFKSQIIAVPFDGGLYYVSRSKVWSKLEPKLIADPYLDIHTAMKTTALEMVTEHQVVLNRPYLPNPIVDNGVITHLNSRSQLHREGCAMANCIVSYHSRCETYNSVLFHVHSHGAEFTVEFVSHTQGDLVATLEDSYHDTETSNIDRSPCYEFPGLTTHYRINEVRTIGNVYASKIEFANVLNEFKQFLVTN